MPVRLFNLRNVPEDEADAVRQLLVDNEIDFYETYAGNWGVSSPGIWLHDDSHLEQAKELIEVYQRERAATARTTYEQLRREGRHPTVMHNIRRHPLQFILLVLMALFILYVSLGPFLNFGN